MKPPTTALIRGVSIPETRQPGSTLRVASRHTDFAVYSVTLNEPIEADPDAARDNLGEVFVRSPWGAVVDVVDESEN